MRLITKSGNAGNQDGELPAEAWLRLSPLAESVLRKEILIVFRLSQPSAQADCWATTQGPVSWICKHLIFNSFFFSAEYGFQFFTDYYVKQISFSMSLEVSTRCFYQWSMSLFSSSKRKIAQSTFNLVWRSPNREGNMRLSKYLTFSYYFCLSGENSKSRGGSHHQNIVVQRS